MRGEEEREKRRGEERRKEKRGEERRGEERPAIMVATPIDFVCSLLSLLLFNIIIISSFFIIITFPHQHIH